MSTTIEIPPTLSPSPKAERISGTFPLSHGPYTIDDWNAFEAGKERKHELRNGDFIEMAGATYEHNLISGNIFGELFIALRETDCEVLGSDQKIFISNTNGLYPDIVVVCGDPLIDPIEALQNPVLIVEVLSSSTAADDRGEKFEKYRTRPTLQHYILVEQDRPTVEHFARGETGLWTLVGEYHQRTETLTILLNSQTIAIPLAAIYRRIDFVAPTDNTSGTTSN